jgi:3-oxoacyl-[acyl-carrier-protein] synthase II
MTGAISRAGIDVGDLGCINAHGTGTDANDRVESKAVARLIGKRQMPVYSFKSQVGHCLGAAGIIEATAGLLAMRNDLVPATINFKGNRPGCQLDYVPNTPVSAEYDKFISCNYAFGGNNAGVVIGKSAPSLDRRDTETPCQRTVITGGGIVSALGLGVARNVSALRAGHRGFKPISERVREITTGAVAGFVTDFKGRDVDRRVDFRPMNPMARFATAAARFALGDAGIRLSPKEGLLTGVVNGVYVGPDEEDYMRAVISTEGREADISIFAQVVANATAGWVSNALQLKGYATTVAQGADAGMFALLLARQAIAGGGAYRIVAGASDELYPQYLRNYNDLGQLCTKSAFGLDFETSNRRVVGEGAAYVVAEEKTHAISRGATILAEVRGHGMNMDREGFFSPCESPNGVADAIEDALATACWQPDDVGLVLWSPQGNRIDEKTVAGVGRALGDRVHSIPFVTSVFHTGLMESASGIATLAAVLCGWRDGYAVWPQITGDPDFDSRPLSEGPTNILAVVASELGFNLALAISPEISAP